MINLNLPKCCHGIKYYELDCEQYKQYLSGITKLHIPFHLKGGCCEYLDVKISTMRCVDDDYIICYAELFNCPETYCERLDLGCLPVDDCVMYFKKVTTIKILLLYKCKWYIADCLVYPKEGELSL